MRSRLPDMLQLWLLLLTASLNGRTHATRLNVPTTAAGASIAHQPNYVSFSIEPAFWVEFWGNASQPNTFTFDVLQLLVDRGGQPQIRPGGETMDSMIFEPSAGNVQRVTSSDGGIYRTVVGPAYYQSWSNFPSVTKFTSTLNFQNDSLAIAQGLAVASVKYQPERVHYFELGNEPNNYATAESRWDDSTQEYVNQWLNWTYAIDVAVNNTLGASAAEQLGISRWWGSSSTTDPTALQVRPANIIPDGIDSDNQVAQYSIHSYQFATCSPAQTALSTLPDVLNHSSLVSYANSQILPSAQAALNSGSQWIIGEYNSVACSGSVNVSDRFAQALWTADTQLLYASMNASATYLHQGATLVDQSSDQANSAGPNGTPSFSLYDMVYPRDSSARGPARALPGFLGVLFATEVFSTPGIRVRALAAPTTVDEDYFAAYSMYANNEIRKVAVLNMQPYYGNGNNLTVSVQLPKSPRGSGSPQAWLKRMSSPSVSETDSSLTTWAGQSYEHGKPVGNLDIEEVGSDGIITVRGSEAVLVFYNHSDVYM
ncbi:glycoside hydrolase family 79 protein [Neohortaea acidophila]|uniref:Glycoside hydrolase family 79 protein n=1 Tax=Neohortaea acidophila TaxID=245834 RepID=A0A6A6PN20_9PEZI|nr:glycoside hydrolase family 79 protein [Neohortaea acidophila]KAF2481315.1 glycoside hydrolase family 79 protein [Neohortaea acidophila]